jgi:hypothetical protein
MRTFAPIAAIHLVGNALLLWLGYYWLGLGETRAATLAWSAFIALLLLSLACWLHGATFAYFSLGRRGLPWRRLPALVAAVIVLLAVYWVLSQWSDYSSKPAFKIASFLTMTFRKPVKPATVLNVFKAVLWLVRWMVVPVVALSIVSRIFARRQSLKWWHWIATPVLLVCALWLPLKLMGWTPLTGAFAMQMFSFVIRLLVAYLLFVGAWLVLVFLISGGSPRATQPSTVASP